MISGDQLLVLSREWLPGGAGAPRQDQLRRVVSTAYYALFHKLIEKSIDQLCGVTAPRALRNATWRSYDHGEMFGLAEKVLIKPTSPQPKQLVGVLGHPPSADLRAVASALCQLRDERHRADYDPSQDVSKREVQLLVAMADAAMATLNGSLLSDDLRVFLRLLPLWGRMRKR